jgi:ribosome-associated protein
MVFPTVDWNVKGVGEVGVSWSRRRVLCFVGGFGMPERFEIPESELQWRFDTSGGPGGQHANRSNTRVELIFDIGSSRAFDGPTRDRLSARLGSAVRISEDGSRSQATNRKRAVFRLHDMLEKGARPDPPQRRATGPSRSARARRLEAKRAKGRTKQQRKSPGLED